MKTACARERRQSIERKTRLQAGEWPAMALRGQDRSWRSECSPGWDRVPEAPRQFAPTLQRGGNVAGGPLRRTASAPAPPLKPCARSLGRASEGGRVWTASDCYINAAAGNLYTIAVLRTHHRSNVV